VDQPLAGKNSRKLNASTLMVYAGLSEQAGPLPESFREPPSRFSEFLETGGVSSFVTYHYNKIPVIFFEVGCQTAFT